MCKFCHAYIPAISLAYKVAFSLAHEVYVSILGSRCTCQKKY